MPIGDPFDVTVDIPGEFPGAFVDYVAKEFGTPRGQAVVSVDPSKLDDADSEGWRHARGVVSKIFKRWRAGEREKIFDSLGEQSRRSEYLGHLAADDVEAGETPIDENTIRGMLRHITGDIPYDNEAFASPDALRNAVLDREIASADKKVAGQRAVSGYLQGLDQARRSRGYLRDLQLEAAARGTTTSWLEQSDLDTLREESRALDVDDSRADELAEAYMNTRADRVSPEMVVDLIKNRVDLNKLAKRGAHFPAWTHTLFKAAGQSITDLYTTLEKDDAEYMTGIKAGIRIGTPVARELASALSAPVSFSELVPDVIGKLPLTLPEKKDAFEEFKTLHTAIEDDVEERLLATAALEAGVDPLVAINEQKRRKGGGEAVLTGDKTSGLDMKHRMNAIRLALRRLSPDDWMERYPGLVDPERGVWDSRTKGDLPSASTNQAVSGFLDNFAKFDAWEEAEKGWQATIGKRARENSFLKNAVESTEDMWVGFYHMLHGIGNGLVGLIGQATPSERYETMKSLYLEHREKEFGELRGVYRDENIVLSAEAGDRDAVAFFAGFVNQFNHVMGDFETSFTGDPVGTIAAMVDLARLARGTASKLSRGDKKSLAGKLADKLETLVRHGDQQLKNHLLVLPAAAQYVRGGVGFLRGAANQISKILRKPMPIAQDIARASEVSSASKRSGALFSPRYQEALERHNADRQPGVSDTVHNLQAHRKAWEEASEGIPPTDVALIAQDVLKSVVNNIDKGLAKFVDDIPVEEAPRILNKVLSGDMRALLRHIPDDEVAKSHRRLTKAGVDELYPDDPDFGPGYGDITPDVRQKPPRQPKGQKGAPPEEAEYLRTDVAGVRAVPEGTRVRKVTIGGRKVDVGEVVNTRLHPGALSSMIEGVLRDADPDHPWTRPVTREGTTKMALEWEIENIRKNIEDGAEYPPPMVMMDEQTGTIIIPPDFPLSRSKLRGTHPRFTSGAKDSVQNAALMAILIETLKDAPPGVVFAARHPATHVPILVPKSQFDKLSGRGQVGRQWGVLDPDTGENIPVPMYIELVEEYKRRIGVLEKERLKQKKRETTFSNQKRKTKKGKENREKNFLSAKQARLDVEAKIEPLREDLGRLERQEAHVVHEGVMRTRNTLTNKELIDEYGAATDVVREWHMAYVAPVLAKIEAFKKAEGRLRVSIKEVGYIGQPGGALKRKMLERELRAARKKVKAVIEVTEVNELLDKARGVSGGERHRFRSAIISEDPKISAAGRAYPESRMKHLGAIEQQHRGIPTLQQRGVRPLRTNKIFVDPDLGGYQDVFFSEAKPRTGPPVTQAQHVRRKRTQIDDTYGEALRDAKSLGLRLRENLSALPADKLVNYLEDARGLQRRRMSLELARVVEPELRRGAALMNGTLKIENEVDMPVVIPGSPVDVIARAEEMGGRTGVAARRMGYQQATPQQKLQMGVAEDSSVVIARPFAMALDDLKALENFSQRNVTSALKSLGTVLKRGKITRSISFAANILSSYMIRGFVDGVWSPRGLIRSRRLIRDYKLGNITDPKILRIMEDFERLGLLSGIDKDISLTVGASGEGRLRARMLSEVVEDKLSGIDATTMTGEEIARRMKGFSALSPRRLLRLYNRAFESLENKYLASDPVFKVDAAMRVIAEYEKLVSDMGTGHTIRIPISETQRVTISKEGAAVDVQDGIHRGLPERIVTDTGMSVREALLRTAALSANRKFFDYTFMPYRQQQGRLAGLDVYINPMFAFTWNARWFPLFKRGLMREILTGSLDYQTTDPKLRGKQLNMVAKQVMKRQIMMATTRQMAMQNEGMPELMEFAMKFKTNGAILDIVEAVGPDEVNILGYSGVSVSVDTPYFSFLEKVAGYNAKSPMFLVGVKEMLEGSPETPGRTLEHYIRNSSGARLDPVLTDKRSLFEHSYATKIPKSSRLRTMVWVAEARGGDSAKFDELRNILESVEGSAPGKASAVANLVQAILGFEGDRGLDPIAHYIEPVAQLIEDGELDRAAFRKFAEITLGSAALGDAISSVIATGDPEEFWRIVRKKKKHIRTIKNSMGRKIGQWRDFVYNDLDVNREDMEGAEADYVSAADAAGARRINLEGLADMLETQARVVERAPSSDSGLERLKLLRVAYTKLESLEAKRRARLIARAAVSMQSDAIRKKLDAQARGIGIIKQEEDGELVEPEYKSTAPSAGRVPFSLPEEGL